MSPLALPLALLAQLAPMNGQAEDAAAVYNGRNGQLDVDAPRVESPSITVDAVLDEPEWANAALLTGFTLYTPTEGTPASDDTEVRVFYSGEAIYFGFHIYDSEPDQILANLSERDRSQSDDWVRIMLDTFNDERQAFTFFISPFGIQSDGIWLESMQPRGGPSGPKVDFNPDYLFESHGQIVDDGWVAEVRIPFVSIRFPDADVQDWGLQIARGIMRKNYKSSWAPLTVSMSSILAQSGRLQGLSGIRPRRLVELNPVATGKLEGARSDGLFERGDPVPEVGLNGRVGLTSNLFLDATLNPDFSQVEADADQVQVNERFALFFSEKRPFFLEGTDIFVSTQRLLHTRRIVDPIVGAKLTGKVGDFSVAYMGAVDESPTSVFGGNSNALFNLVRVRRDVGAGSSVGLIYTDRSLTRGGLFNRVVSGDARLLLGGRYALEGQLTGSWTRAVAPGESTGLKPAVTLALSRSGLNFRYNAKVEDLHPEFAALSGHMPRVGDTEASGGVELDLIGAEGALVERWGLVVNGTTFFDHDEFWEGGSPFEWEMTAAPQVDFRDARSLSVTFGLAGFRFRAEDFEDHTVVGAGGEPEPMPTVPDLSGLWSVAVRPNLRFTEAVRLSGSVTVRETPLFAEGSLGKETRIAPSLQVRPTNALNINANYTWARLDRGDGTRFSQAGLARLQVQYQFSRSIFARVIGQYDLETRAALTHPVTGQDILIRGNPQPERRRGDFQGQALVSYEPSPGTVFFIGYSRVMDGPYGYSLGDKRLLEDGFFVKLSYLWRL